MINVSFLLRSPLRHFGRTVRQVVRLYISRKPFKLPKTSNYKDLKLREREGVGGGERDLSETMHPHSERMHSDKPRTD